MYPIEVEIPATFTTAEYRKYVRTLFQMDLTEVEKENRQIQEHNDEPWDDETTDEMLYDNGRATKFMDYVETETKSDPLFACLYQKAAAKMFSTDLGIGLAVLGKQEYFFFFFGILHYLIIGNIRNIFCFSKYKNKKGRCDAPQRPI